ncbi:hypothetical protein CJU89_1198 [Yarrowia sp. B02]|nr:hypothetical protein CJU89_1198 [Yarrowia sp. B02]
MYFGIFTPPLDPLWASDTESIHGRYTSQHGITVNHGYLASMVVAVVSTPRMLAVHVCDLGINKILISYSPRKRLGENFDLCVTPLSAKCILFGTVDVLVLQHYFEGKEWFYAVVDGEQRQLFARPRAKMPEDVSYFLYDGEIWEFFLFPPASSIVIQTIHQTNKRKIVVPYNPDNQLRFVHEPMYRYRYLVVLGKESPQYLVDLAESVVYAWKDFFSHPTDNCLVGMSDDTLGAWIYDFTQPHVRVF